VPAVTSEVSPNQRHSNLSPELQAYVRTPDFQARFGDWEGAPESASRMTDENGEPQLFYSGLPSGITQLSGDRHGRTTGEGFYFTKLYGNAKGFAAQLRDPASDEHAPGSVYACFLNARNPYVVRREDGIDTGHVTPRA
jgi:hypothetical protein